MTTTFNAPGPGHWAIDRSHFPGGTTPISQWLMEQSMEPGMRRVFAELGVPADGLQARFVNGFMYTRLRPLVRPDKPPSKSPPAFVLRVASRVHPEFRRRTKTATDVLKARPWVDVARRWNAEIKPGLEQANRQFQEVDVGALDDEELGRHVADLLAHCRTNTELHFWLHGHDLGPLARYLYCCEGWGITADEALPALAGASPSTSEPLRQLAELRRMVNEAGVNPTSLDDVRNVSPGAAAALDAYMARRGQLIVTRYDLDGLTLAELPGVVLASIRDAAVPVDADADPVIAALRERVPEGERESFDVVLGDARAVMDMRDDNGPLTYEWPVGLLRRALLEVGRRLVAQGRADDPELALELTPAEAPRVLTSATPDGPELARRAAERAARADLTPPDGLGPEEPAPPLDVLPSSLAEIVAMVQVALAQMGMVGEREIDPLQGAGVGATPYEGRVRIATSPEEAIDTMEPGDVLVVRATSPAFNAVLAIAGAVVTAAGGPLSHAAVLARELGIPAVVGAPGALDLTDGATVVVDPQLGAVRVLTV
jgi:pyruvate,water dikinase